MIECVINGHKTYPSVNNGLKIVIENPAMRQKSSYTYDISFPLSIPANAKFFTHVNMINVSVKTREYEDCRLIVNNKVLFSGKGLVVSVSSAEVKLQIVEEVKSSLPEALSRIFIDSIPYKATDPKYFQAIFDYDREGSFDGDEHGLVEWYDAKPELQQKGFLGERGFYTFIRALKGSATGNSIEDFVNVVCLMRAGHVDEWPLYNLAVQPNFLYVLRHCLEHAGYQPDLSTLEVEPWTDLYVCSTVRSLYIGAGLPHWTIAKLVEETEKLFNVSFKFEGNKVTVKKIWDSEPSSIVVLDYEEEFERTYDEEGTEYEDTSNLAYQLADTHEPTDNISREVLNKFGVKEYASESLMRSAVSRMNAKEKTTSFFSCPEYPYIFYYHVAEEEGDASELRPVGVFRPLYRDFSSDNEKPLNITPVGTETDNMQIPLLTLIGKDDVGRFRYYYTDNASVRMAYPVANEFEVHEEWITVQDVVEDGSSMEDEEDEIPMELMFVGPMATKAEEVNVGYMYSAKIITAIINLGVPSDFLYKLGVKMASLALNSCRNLKCIGDFHVTRTQIDKSTGFNSHEETIFKFVSTVTPAIGSIFLIGNKRYIAKQLELQLREDGLSKEITGHFYALDS